MVLTLRNLQAIQMILILGCVVLLREGQKRGLKLQRNNKSHVKKHGKMKFLKIKVVKKFILILNIMRIKKQRKKLTNFSEAMK